MYSVDERDSVVELQGLPQSDVGAPSPLLQVGERHLHLAYHLLVTPEICEAAAAHVLSDDLGAEPVALVRFGGARVHMFGAPNDEVLHGHPLASRGLGPYSAFEVRDSSWIRQLERMNSVHPQHNSAWYSLLHHYVFTFHDSTFECIARDFSISLHTGTTLRVLAWAQPEEGTA